MMADSSTKLLYTKASSIYGHLRQFLFSTVDNNIIEHIRLVTRQQCGEYYPTSCLYVAV
jgi:hypothetical protein